jgi:M6 family metalloprotease-like protein
MMASDRGDRPARRAQADIGKQIEGTAMPAPFIDEVFTFTQPDATTIQLRGTGNQYTARFETLDGLPVVQDPVSGFYHLARLSPDGSRLRPGGIRPGALPLEIAKTIPWLSAVATAPKVATAAGGLERGTSRWERRRQERRAATKFLAANAGLHFAPPQRTTVGTYVGLTLLVEFPDVPAQISREEVEAFCNQPGYSGFGNAGSVRDYYLDVSGDRLDYSNIVAPWFTAKHERDYYTNEQVPQPVRARELIGEALEHLKSTGFDFSALTADEKEYVYALNVFYAGSRVNSWAKGLWPHSFHLDQPIELAPNLLAFDYQVTNMGHELTLGTFCHENGHMICDFPDLYDYGSESSGVGVFCLMCGGGAGSFEKNPAQVSAYLKNAAGWSGGLTPITPGSTITLDAEGNDFAILRKSATEYFLIENRLAGGRDAGLPGGGLAVWHVDEVGDNSNEQMTPSQHYECSLVQADGRTDLERRRNQGQAADLFHANGTSALDGKNPANRWWDGSPSGLKISGIGPIGQQISFNAA